MEISEDQSKNGLEAECQELIKLKGALRDRENLEYVAGIFDSIQRIVLFRLFWLLFFTSVALAIAVWLLLEEKNTFYAQAIFFLVGAIS